MLACFKNKHANNVSMTSEFIEKKIDTIFNLLCSIKKKQIYKTFNIVILTPDNTDGSRFRVPVDNKCFIESKSVSRNFKSSTTSFLQKNVKSV